MSESFGARLRQRREEQQIALATIAEQTKIKQSLLEALERDDVSHWPYGIFRRAFIRAYAEAIGLSPDVVVKEFFEVHPEPPEMLSSPWTEPAGPGVESFRMSQGPPTRLRYLVGSAIEWTRRRRPTNGDDAHPERRAPAAPMGTIDPPVPPPTDRDDAQELAAPAADVQKSVLAEPAPPVEPGRGGRSLPDTPVAPGERAERHIERAPAAEPRAAELDFGAVAHLCTELGRAGKASEVQPLLAEAARVLEATGVIVWVWDEAAGELRPAIVHGYSARVLAQLPTVRRDTDNATAAAFRSAQPRAISGRDHTSGALVVPLLTPAGCSGVLAIELHDGREQSVPIRAVATILAAMLAQLVGIRPAEVLSESISASR